MHLHHFADETPDKLAHVVLTDSPSQTAGTDVAIGGFGVVDLSAADPVESETYRSLADRADAIARLWYRNGLDVGDCVALASPSNSLLMACVWAAQRSGLRYTTLNPKLSVDEIAHIVIDSNSSALVVDHSLAELAAALHPVVPDDVRRWIGGVEAGDHGSGDQGTEPVDGFADLADELADDLADDLGATGESSADIELPWRDGADLLYTSGSSGRPKGIERPLPEGQPGEEAKPMLAMMEHLYGFDASSVYLASAPIFHSASLRYAMLTNRAGATNVLMPAFDPELWLKAVERWQVTHTQVVPSMLVRLMKLDPEVRLRYNVSSLQFVVHSGASCPPEVKRQVIEWLGPVVYEAYAATEGLGVVVCSTEEWLQRPGTVGRPLFGSVHICDDEGNELPVGEVGTVWMAGGAPFAYRNLETVTDDARHPEGWQTVHDLGSVDEDGYLYLRGRKDDMVTIHGVNVYPSEVEQLLVDEPTVLDAAVVARADDEAGHRLVAYVQANPQRSVPPSQLFDLDATVDLDLDLEDPDPDLEVEPAPSPEDERLVAHLRDICQERLPGIKRPAAFHVVASLPRTENGKLARRLLPDSDEAGLLAKEQLDA